MSRNAFRTRRVRVNLLDTGTRTQNQTQNKKYYLHLLDTYVGCADGRDEDG